MNWPRCPHTYDSELMETELTIPDEQNLLHKCPLYIATFCFSIAIIFRPFIIHERKLKDIF